MPMVQLTQMCDPQMMIKMANMGQANIECICNNPSFDVSVVGGLCSNCMMQAGVNNNELMRLESTCQFESASYQPSATVLVQGVVVTATAPTGTMTSGVTAPMTTGGMAGMSMNAAGAFASFPTAYAAAGAVAYGVANALL
ncbi:hypothetical protein LTS18_002133 [Coniosporium uncinatum]|uniref:Uncharacterized protein n=1 Tax=Coniosporium uncinatum TaxID=93489 RepID=A0ACC3DUD1_9PEZI|nr:hypothetical protein LTS18_002133 [Coniosporium uncinatum]